MREDKKKKIKHYNLNKLDSLQIESAILPVSVNMMRTANMSGYSASTPGAFMDMCSLQNSSIRFPINSSKVALHARATLEVPNTEKVCL